ncbi:MAG: hypothetical protein K8S98_17965 [Planctomycetes bacterium]|nr:hypothetical protein [Planctomycetota bacterium]
MRTIPVLLLSGLACSACALPPIAIETDEAIVHASPQHADAARESVEIVRCYLPVIERALGAGCERPVIYLLDGELEGPAIGVFLDGDRTIRIGTEALSELRSTLVHELVHFGALTTRWKSLPNGLQEGLAYWLELELVELRGKLQASIEAPAAELRREVSSPTFAPSVDDGIESHRRSAALWVIARLGPGRLDELVARAELEGVATVPVEWIEAALPVPLDERAELPSLMELLYYDAHGALVRADVGSLSSAWKTPPPPGTVRVEVRALDLPTYDGPQAMWVGMSVRMPAVR